jgi:hypothetical protein
MKQSVGRAQIGALALVATLVSCGLFAGSYRVEISSTSSVVSQLHSLYAIVSLREEVAEPLLTRSKNKDLLDEDRINRYTAFAQFQPEDSNTWKLIYVGRPSEYVSFKVKADQITIKVKHQLIEKSGGKEYNLVLLAQLGNGEFEQVTVNHASLNDNAKQVVHVSGGSLQLLDK